MRQQKKLATENPGKVLKSKPLASATPERPARKDKGAEGASLKSTRDNEGEVLKTTLRKARRRRVPKKIDWGHVDAEKGDAGVGISWQFQDGETPVDVAQRAGHLNIVRLLEQRPSHAIQASQVPPMHLDDNDDAEEFTRKLREEHENLVRSLSDSLSLEDF
jgi:hypothetical protein